MSIEITSELCYFLGLVTGRGRIYDSNSNKRIIIEIPHKNQIQTGIPFCPICKTGVVTNSKCKNCSKSTTPEYKVQFEQRKEVINTVNQVISPLVEKIVGIKPEISGSDVYTYLSIDFSDNHKLFDLIKNYFSPFSSFLGFEIPSEIHDMSDEHKLEYLAGIADTAGFPIWGNWHTSGLTRMYIQIPNSNWKLPVQLCNFMQNELDIPIQTIDWGHPNIRDGKMMEYKEGKLLSAFREHQLKIFSDQFKRVPMKFIHKKKLLSELIKYNNLLKIDSSKFCMPPKQITSNQVKVFHDAENSDKLPQELKGKHFDAFWQICWVMGCDRCEGSKNDPISEAIFLSGKSELQSLECEQSRISKIRQDTTQKLEPIWKKIQSKIKSKVKRKKSSFTEADTYEPQKKWLQKYLEKKYPNSKIETFVVADSDMSSFFTRMGNEQHADLMEEYDIRPDVVGIIDGDKLAFIESKITQLGIKEIGQLLGYCLVSEPEIAILCSTKESSGKLTTILPHQELFEYGKNAKIQCATWSQNKGTMDFLGET